MGASKFVEDNMDWLEIVEETEAETNGGKSTPTPLLDKWRAEQENE